MSAPVSKLAGFEFWEKTLKKAKYVVAPMVDQSELAWRMLSRRLGAHLCYTPMLHASVFVRDATYREEALRTCPEDRPLIVQFCANDPEMFCEAAVLAQDHCDAVDLNLGCPQSIAKRGHYGAFLQDEWDLLEKMVSLCHSKLRVPVTCKIRVFESVERTVAYARMLERAGCQLLTVHGRRREQKGPLTGLASWDHIRAVREAVKVPVLANGNIQSLADVEDCIKHTQVQGVMSAEGNLHNPALFSGHDSPPAVWDMADQYLEMVDRYPCPMSYIRGHLFKILLHSLEKYPEMRVKLGICKTIDAVKEFLKQFTEILKADELRYKENPDSFNFGELKEPYWICQPYVRPDPTVIDAKMAEGQKRRKLEEDSHDGESDQCALSKNKQKKLKRYPGKSFEVSDRGRGQFNRCGGCQTNAKGEKCEHSFCKVCCRRHCHESLVSCQGHKIRVWKPNKSTPSSDSPS